MNSRIFRLLISISIGLLSCISIFAFVRSASDHNQVANFVSPTQAYNNVVQTIAHKPVIIQSTAIPEIMNLPGNPSIVNTTGMVAGNNINTSQEQNTISRPAQTIKSISSNSISTISQDVSTALSNGFKEQINSEEAVSNLPPIMLPQTSASDLLTVTAPTTASIIGPSNGFINESQHFTAVSEPNTATAPLSYNWQTIEHGNIHHFNGITDTIDLSWSQVGTHRITVTVSNGNGTISDVFTTTILDKLISGLNAISNSPTPLGSTTQFTATALTGTNIHYIWDFGDASSGSGSSVIHKYTTTGIFSVTLRAENSAGVYTKTLLSQVKILPAVTLSNFSTNEGALYVTAGSFTDPDSAVWTGTVYFGDGSNLQNLTINPNKTFTLTHSYLDSGLFNVNVQIVDEIGGKGIVTVTATIANLAPTANLTSTIQVNEGSPAIMAFNNQYDPSSVDTSAGFFYSYDFNNDWIYEITASVHPSATIPSSYLPDGPYTQTLHAKIEDKNSGFSIYTTTVAIRNVIPILTNLAISDIKEGDFALLTGDVVDPGVLDTITLTVDWGEGTSELLLLNAGQVTFSLSHQYLDDNPTATSSDPYTITLNIVDKDNAASSISKVFHVDNIAPSFSNLTSTNIFENGSTTLTGLIVDPGSKDLITILVNWGDGANQVFTYTAGTTSFTQTHQFLDDNPTGTSIDLYTILLNIKDDDLGSTNDSTSFTITNAKPGLTNLTATPINETGTTILTGNISDIGTLDTFILTVTWAEGVTQVFTYPAGTTNFSVAHQYIDDNPSETSSDLQPISVELKDDDNGSVTAATTVKVTNIAPTIVSLNATNISENGISTLTGVISDTSIQDSFILTVTWGDGSIEPFFYPAGTTHFSETHRYLDDNITDSYFVNVTLSDDDLGKVIESTGLIVTNIAPSLNNVVLTSMVTENFTATLSGKIIDPGTLDTFTLVVNWGDGSSIKTYNYGAGTTDFSLTHRYLDDNPTATISDTYTVNLTITDDDGGSDSDSKSLVVNNANPSFSNVTIDNFITENGYATLKGVFSDPGTQDSFSLTVNWGDSSNQTYPFVAGTRSFTVTHQYLDDNPSHTSEDIYTINLTLKDDDNGTASTSKTLLVKNVDPSLTAVVNDVYENGVATLVGQITDPGTKDPITITIEWGDGTSNDVLSLASNTKSFSKTHTYLDDKPSNTSFDSYQITIIAEDDDLGFGTTSKNIKVTNLNPNISGLTATNTNENGSTNLSGTIIDVGTLDTFTMTVNWGDSFTDIYTFTASNRSFSKFHKYMDDDPTNTSVDQYTISITVSDDDLGTSSYTKNIFVSNVAPQLSNLATTPISENQITTLTGRIIDPGTRDNFTLTIDWGDSSTSSQTFASSILVNGSFPFTMTHQYLDDQPSNTSSDIYTIKVTIADDDLGSSSATVSQYISNSAPTLSLVSITPIVNENDTATLTAKINDPSILDTFNVTVNWGDATITTTPFPAGTTNFTLTHQYLDDNPTGTASDIFPVTISVVDDDLGLGTGSTTLVVANIKPKLSALLATSVYENQISTLTGQIIDLGTKDTFRLIVAWGDGKSDSYTFPAGTKTFSKTHLYQDDNPTGTLSDPFTILVVIYDDDNGTNTGSASLTVSNIAPVLSNLRATNTNENGMSTLTGKITDPGTEDTFSLAIGWGDGVTDFIPYPAGTTNFTATHIYLDDNPSGTPSDNYSIEVIALDDDNGVASSSTINWVTNVNPILSNLAVSTVSENNLANLSGIMSDMGSQDTFTMTVDWGDSNSDRYNLIAGTTAFNKAHRYLDNGTYTVTVTLTDDDTGTTSKTTIALVTNTVPKIIGVSATNISENNFSTLSGTILDPGPLDSFTINVNWGDGTNSSHTLPAGSNMFAIHHQYLDDQPSNSSSDRYDISVEIFDKDMGKGTAFTNLIVSNTAPGFSRLTATNINENIATTLTGTINDPGSLDTFTMTISWGDGSSNLYMLPAGTTIFTYSHKYLDDNPTGTSIDLYSILVAIQDDDLGQGNKSTTIQVKNSNPKINNLLITPGIQENSLATLTGNIFDSGPLDTFTLNVDWGDGSPKENFSGFAAGSAIFTQTHLYQDDNPSGTSSDLYTVTVTVTDDDLGKDSGSALLIVHNGIPQISNLSLTPSINENGTAVLSGSILDIGKQDAYTLTVNWGDGSLIEYQLAAGSTSFNINYIYLDDKPDGTSMDTYPVVVSLMDDDLGAAATVSGTITVKNVAPYFTNLNFTNIFENNFATLSGNIVDPGTKDIYSMTILWGDGSAEAYLLPAGTTNFTKIHKYIDDNPTGTPSDFYTATLTLNDDDLGHAPDSKAKVKVSNSAPRMFQIKATTIFENGTTQLTGSISDPGLDDTFNLSVNWGDGSNNIYNLPAGTTVFTQSHQYMDDNPSGTSTDKFPIDLVLTDDDLGQFITNTLVTVNNTAPTILSLFASDVFENGSTNLSGQFSDPGKLDSFILTVNWGDNSFDSYSLAPGSTTFSQAHQYLDDDPTLTPQDIYTITVALEDDDTGKATFQKSITVTNVAPVIQNIKATNTDENSWTTLSAKIVDPGTKDTFDATIDWGDGYTNTIFLSAGTTSLTQTHQYLDDNPSGTSWDTNTIQLTVTDDDTGQSRTSTQLIISNVVPSLNGVKAISISENGTTHLTGQIIDPGSNDSFELKVNWGDGSEEIFYYPAGKTYFTETHTYLDDDPSTTSADLFTLKLDLSDDDSGTFTATTTLTVTNEAPAFLSLNAKDTFEAGFTTLTGQFEDPGTHDTFTLTVDWGDGVTDKYNQFSIAQNGVLSFTQTHQYLDDNPTATASDPYSITVTIEDDDQGSVTQQVKMTVTNIAPIVVVPAINSVNEGSSFNLTGSFTDPGKDIWKAKVNFGDGLGEWALPIGPNKNFSKNWVYDDNGVKTIKISVDDDDLGTGVITQTIRIENDPPTAVFTGTTSVPEGTTGKVWFDQIFDPSLSDTQAGFSYSFDFNLDGFFDILASPSPSATIPAYMLANGPEVVLIKGRIEDKDHGFNDYILKIFVTDSTPVAMPDMYTIPEDQTLSIAYPGVLGNDVDVPSDILSAFIVTQTSHGTLALFPNGAFVYKPVSNYNGSDSFIYKAHSGELLSSNTPVTITIIPVNDVPITQSDIYTVSEDSILQVASAAGVLSNDKDIENDPLSATLIKAPSSGSLTLNSNGGYKYIPGQSFFGIDTFIYKASDGFGLSEPTLVTIIVTAIPNEPIAQDDYFNVLQAEQLIVTSPGVLQNDQGTKSLELYSRLVSQPLHGDVFFMQDGGFTYTSNRSFTGEDTFTYVALDGFGKLSKPAVVHIQVSRKPEDLFSFDHLIVSSPILPQAGLLTEIDLTVIRTGGNSSLQKIVEVAFYLNNISPANLIGITTINDFQPDSSNRTAPISWMPVAPGVFTIYAVIDPANVVQEQDENNNIISRQLTVYPRSNPVDQIKPVINLFKINLGAAMAENLDLSLYLKASDVGSQVTKAFFAEFVYSQTLNTWTPVQTGTWVQFNGNSTTYPWTIDTTPGVHYVIAWVSDQYGNISDPSITHINYNPQIVSVNQNQVLIYRLTLQTGQIITATLTSISGDADIYAFSPLQIDGNRILLGASYSTGTDDYVVIHVEENGVFQIEIEGYSAAQYNLTVQIASQATNAHVSIDDNFTPAQPKSKARSIPINNSDPAQDYPLPAPYAFRQIFIPIFVR